VATASGDCLVSAAAAFANGALKQTSTDSAMAPINFHNQIRLSLNMAFLEQVTVVYSTYILRRYASRTMHIFQSPSSRVSVSASQRRVSGVAPSPTTTLAMLPSILGRTTLISVIQSSMNSWAWMK
jgi:hypothetical protein